MAKLEGPQTPLIPEGAPAPQAPPAPLAPHASQVLKGLQQPIPIYATIKLVPL